MTHHLQSKNGRRALAAFASFAVLGLVGFVLPACAGEKSAAAGKPAADKNAAVAEIAGKTVTMAELEESIAPQLARLDQQRQQLLEQGLDRLVDQKLMEAEAAARGVDVAALQQTEIQSKVGEVTDTDVSTWYDQNKSRVGGRPLEQIAPQVKQYLTQQRTNEAREALMKGLRNKFKTRILMDVPRVEVAEAGSPAEGGAPGAPVTIVEFSDFQCPFCGRVVPALQKAKETYGDKLRIVFRQFPLNIHPMAPKAAEAALCAADQGKFWEMHDAMFADQQKLAVPDLKAKAAAIGLEAAKFEGCLDGGGKAQVVQRDLADGQKAGVSGTPAMFVNGRFISGAVPYEDLAKVIDDELARKGVENPSAK